VTLHSQEITAPMVRACIELSQPKKYNVYYVKLKTQHIVVEAHTGTRAPHFCHIWKRPPLPPHPRATTTQSLTELFLEKP